MLLKHMKSQQTNKHITFVIVDFIYIFIEDTYASRIFSVHVIGDLGCGSYLILLTLTLNGVNSDLF